MNQIKEREEKLEAELRDKDDEIRQLRQVNIDLQKKQADNTVLKHSEYLESMEKRVEDCLEESKRHLAKYVDLRNFAYEQIDSLIRQLNRK